MWIDLARELVWPATLIFLVLFVKKDLLLLLKEISKIKWKDFEAEFGKEMETARIVLDSDDLEEHEEGNSEPDKEHSRRQSVHHALLDVSPRHAILESWRTLESKIGLAGSVLGMPAGRSSPSHKIVENLVDKGIFDESTVNAFVILRSLRNRAAHDSGFTASQDDAREFIDMIDEINSRIDKKLEILETHRGYNDKEK